MSLSAAINVSLSGINASSLQLEQAASNIANASTKGYTAKTVTTSASVLGAVGGGVQVEGFSRSENSSLFKTLTVSTSTAAYRKTQDEYLQQVMDLLGTSSSDDPPLSQTLGDFINAWNILSGSPESLVEQRQVISCASALCEEMQRQSAEVEALDRQCKSEVDSVVSDLNAYLSQIKSLNEKIAQAINSDLSSGDLVDKRDQLILKISEITEITIMPRANGQIALYTKGGYQLVDGGTVRTFVYNGTDVTSQGNSALSLNNVLTGGKLQALVAFRSDTSPAVTQADISASLTDANADLLQIQTLNTQIVAEQLLGNDTSALEAGRALLVADLDGIIGITTIDNGDGSINVETDGGYELLNGATISTLSFDGTNVIDAAAPTVSLNLGLTGGSLEIQLASYSGPASVSSDPATSIIQKLRDQLDSIVKAFTTTVSTATSGVETFAQAYNNAASNTGNLSANFFTGTTRQTFAVNAALLDGSATVKATAASAVSTSLLDKTRSFSSKGLTVIGSNYSTFLTSGLITFQQSASNISTLSSTSEDARTYLEEKLSNETGVNTDMELASLVTFQNAYSASAHVMSIVQELFKVMQNLM